MRKTISFASVMKASAILSFSATLILIFLYRRYLQSWIFAAAITAGTTFYHFAMRLLVGFFIPLCVKDPIKRNWFQPKSFEAKLYRFLNVKHWKDRMPTYAPASFSRRENTLQQVVVNCCVSETVHEVIVVFSFLPLIFTLWWGAFPVFLITSLFAAAFDGCFAIMQRYNRPRLQRILAKKEGKALE